MANAASAVPQSALPFVRPLFHFAGLLPAFLVISLLATRLAGSYFAVWAVGILGALYVIFRGRSDERWLLFVLVALSVIAGGEQMDLGFRAVLFTFAFVFMARYVAINPWFLLTAQLSFFALGSVWNTGILIELFVYGPSVVFVVLSTEMLRDSRNGGGPLRRLVALVFNILSLVLSATGLGSRSALFVWVMANMRQLSIFYLALLGGALVAAIPVLLVLQDLPVVQKLGNSISEMIEPVDLNTGGVSQRGIENLMFVGYIVEASPREILLGSTKPMFLDGAPLGQDKDVKFIPHNQFFGTVFQFGFVGSFVLLIYIVRLRRYFIVDRYCAFMLVILLLPGFVFKGGFYDSDLATLTAMLTWIRERYIERSGVA